MSSYPKYDKYSEYQSKKKPGRYQRFTQFLKNAKRIIKTANKPSKKEYWLIFKICGIGIVVLGVLSYIIQLIFSVVLPVSG
jgi:protein transport protein SEC61 subunit gamma-like protein